MKAENFCYWLQGLFELGDPNPDVHGLTAEQTTKIRAHLNMVFVHDIDPKMGGPEHQAKLNELHGDLKPFRPPGMRC